MSIRAVALRCVRRGALALLLVLFPTLGNAGHYAVLIGISDYADTALNPLEGPGHDLVAMTGLLIASGYKKSHIVTLHNEQATLQGILDAIDWLERTTATGDSVFFYFSGHGTSAYDPLLLAPLPYDTGALVPYDANFNQAGYLQKLLVGKETLRPFLSSLDRQEINTLVVLDTCYSEYTSRDLTRRSYRSAPRVLPPDARSLNPQSKPVTVSKNPPSARKIATVEYPYRHVWTIAAAASDQLALDIDYKTIDTYPTIDGFPHGALTDSLLRAIRSSRANSEAGHDLTTIALRHAVQVRFDTIGLDQTPKFYPDNPGATVWSTPQSLPFPNSDTAGEP